MKSTVDKKKGSEAISELVHKTVDSGKKTATKAKNNVNALVEKAKNDSFQRKLKKLNPVFPDQYKSEDFHIPNMIVIVDDAVRRGIELCDGAIGWLGKEKDVEILYLYDEAIEFSGVQFVPSANCDAIYYVDSYDRNKFIRTDCIFQKAHEERLAELEHIAHCLGAKRCSIEITESNKDRNQKSKKASLSKSYNIPETTLTYESNENAEHLTESTGSTKRSGCSVIEFEGSSTPTMPTLKWFAHDDSIKHLIEMRCSGNNPAKTKTLTLSGSSYATMSQKTAYSIDNAINQIGSVGGQASMDSQAAKEHHSKLVFHIEF